MCLLLAPCKSIPETGELVSLGFIASLGLGSIISTSMKTGPWKVSDANTRHLSFLAEAGWLSCLKATLMAKELGVEERGRGEESQARGLNTRPG